VYSRGGLGHFGILWANAMGAEVYAISTSANKKEDALKLGAKHFINSRDEKWHEQIPFTLDFILNCADATHKFKLSDYFSTLKVNGTFHNVGFPDEPLPTIQAQDFAPNGCYIGASHIGNRPEMLAMLELASKQNIKSWVQTIDISEAGCKEAVERVYKNDVKFRFTLVNYDKQFGVRT
jgi:alcohol dehydrogenase (NADP+)